MKVNSSMEFVDLPEHTSGSHVLAISPILYRLDARSTQGSFVVTEYQNRRPYFALSGDTEEARHLFEAALGMLEEADPYWVLEATDPCRTIRNNGKNLPFWTLEIRSPHREYEVIWNGFHHGVVLIQMVQYGIVSDKIVLFEDIKQIRERLRSLHKVYYGIE